MENKVREHYEAACDEALAFVEKEARYILKRCKNLNEFVMAMGSFFFIDKSDEIVDTTETTHHSSGGSTWDHSKPIFKKLNDFMSEWDDVLKISGEPMRFTKDGPKITDW